MRTLLFFQRKATWKTLAWLAAALWFSGCRSEDKPEPFVQAVRAGTIEHMVPSNEQRYSATLAPYAQVDLAFKSPGLVDYVCQVRGADGRIRDIQMGDPVDQGTELARVRTLDYEQRVRRAEQQVRQAEAQLAQAEAALRHSREDFARADTLYRASSLTRPDYDRAKAALDSAQASVDAANAGVSTVRTAVEETQLALNDTAVRAPFSGYITARNVQVGSLAGNQAPGFSMMDTHLVKAVFAVPDYVLTKIRLGQKQTVLFEAVQHRLQGTITAISPQADPKSRVFTVEVTLANPGNQVRPGMIGTLILGPEQPAKSRLAVPLDAIVRSPDDSGAFAVFRIETRDGKTFAYSRNISTGNTYGNSIEVDGGVSEGERIVVMGAALLRNGQEVRLIQ